MEGTRETTYFLDAKEVCLLYDGVQLPIRCFSTNGQLVYLRPDLSGCFISRTAEQTLARSAFTPTRAKAEHGTGRPDYRHRSLLQLEPSLQAKDDSNKKALLNASTLSAGICVVKVTGITGEAHVGKFWKK